MQTGIETVMGAAPTAYAIASAEKPTCDKPSPIIEYLLRTRLVPRRAEQSETKIPTMSALCRNGYDSISIVVLSIFSSSCMQEIPVEFSVFFDRTEELLPAVQMEHVRRIFYRSFHIV